MPKKEAWFSHCFKARYWHTQVFALGRSANVYVIYKDEITTGVVQSPLFSYVTFAKVAKITGITL